MNNESITCLSRLAALLALTLTAACGGGGSAGGEPAATSPLGLDAARSVTQTVGRAGGTLSTTGADGSVYTLTVPPRALRSATSITLAPIAAIGDLPTGVTLTAGAHLTPEGQAFDMPVKLEIALARPPSSAPIPFTYAGTLTQRRLYPATLSGKSIQFEVVHFSGYAALLGTPHFAIVHDPNSYLPTPGAAGDQALQALVDASIGLQGDPRAAAMRAALRGWLDNVIKPAVVAAHVITSVDVNPAGSTSALLTLTRLRSEMQVFNVALKWAVISGGGDLDAIAFDSKVAARDAARHAIPLMNAACSSFNAAYFLAVPDVFAWQQIALETGATTLDATLQRSAVLDELCVQVAYDPNGGTDFPTGIHPGQTGTLGVRAGYSVNGGPVRFDLPMFVVLTGASGVTPSGLLAPFAVAAGATLQRQFLWEPSTTEMRIDVDTCLADELLREICQQAFVVRGAQVDIEFDFANGLQGWSVGTGGRPLDSVRWIDNIGNPPGAVQLDGSDFMAPDGLPNAWISRSISLPPTATLLTFATRASPENGALRVRLVAPNGAAVTLLDWEVLSGTNWVTRSASLTAYAGQIVTIYFEQGDNDIGVGEHRYIDNVRIASQ
jgi:hypothetical protein